MDLVMKLIHHLDDVSGKLPAGFVVASLCWILCKWLQV